MTRVAGVVLAGGRSRRFGETDKALAHLDGVPLVRRTAGRVMQASDELVLNCRREQASALEDACADLAPRMAIDTDPDTGPLGGIRTGLAATDAPLSAVVACDMPFVDPGLLELLLAEADETGADVVVPRVEDGWFQTTQAVYRTASVSMAAEEVLDRGGGRILDAFDSLDVRTVGAEVLGRFDPRTFENVNTRAELDAAEAEIRRRNAELG
ncbi:NTP transferase domain-containing protein [Haloferax sp. MBLA0076]|uniref:Probable molybdenum cofactor guanylyltransferase n=1 Tax=Haloferax litoreum TaxID=2666140 RepID=A0A6A8GE71_9EURY|nr:MULTISPECIES: molybdenum cofactor guanylyltransferase [Haloferax]KAB1192006.1 molybdenum cofactor guanylyltransferase [Haloferax sp. CBA1148]MRX20447.1 NTP transferase domain-containing protein [Haloferax litoreum]